MADMRRHATTRDDMSTLGAWGVGEAPPPSCCADLVPLLDVASQANTSKTLEQG